VLHDRYDPVQFRRNIASLPTRAAQVEQPGERAQLDGARASGAGASHGLEVSTGRLVQSTEVTEHETRFGAPFAFGADGKRLLRAAMCSASETCLKGYGAIARHAGGGHRPERATDGDRLSNLPCLRDDARNLPDAGKQPRGSISDPSDLVAEQQCRPAGKSLLAARVNR
jgi:hypothetical protein